MASNSEGGKIADALVSGLNDASLSQSFTAAVGFSVRLQLEDAETLHVDVVPVKASAERHDRGAIAWGTPIDIGVRYRFPVDSRNSTTGAITAAAVETYRYLLQQIVEWVYANPRLSDYTTAVLSEDAEIRADVIPKHLEELGQFTGIARVTYHSETEIS